MNWEKEALVDIIKLLVRDYIRYDDLWSKLDDLGIRVDSDGSAFEILTEITTYEGLSESLQGHKENDLDEKELINLLLTQIKLKYKD
jgi:hypothetical protein